MKKHQRYTAEFRAEAVRMLEEEGLSQGEAARRLGIPEGTLPLGDKSEADNGAGGTHSRR